MDKQTAERLACLIAAELISDTARVEAIIEREGIAQNGNESDLLAEALELLYSELLERSNGDESDPGLRERYEQVQAKFKIGDHNAMIEQLRESAEDFKELFE